MSDEHQGASGEPRAAIWRRQIQSACEVVAEAVCEIHDTRVAEKVLQAVNALRDLEVRACADALAPAPDAELREQVEFQRARADKWVAIAERYGSEIEALKARADALAPAPDKEPVRPVGCPVECYSGVPEALHINVTRAFFAGLGARTAACDCEGTMAGSHDPTCASRSVGADALAPPSTESDDLAHDAKVQAVHLRLTQRANELHSAHVALEEAAEEIVNLHDKVADALAPPEPTLQELARDLAYYKPIAERLMEAAPRKVQQLHDVLRAIRRRLHFVGMPQEPLDANGRPLWRNEIRLIEDALRAAPPRADALAPPEPKALTRDDCIALENLCAAKVREVREYALDDAVEFSRLMQKVIAMRTPAPPRADALEAPPTNTPERP